MNKKRVFNYNDKRALSAVVTTLIIILLVLVAIGIMWVVVRNILTEGAEEVSLEKLDYSLAIKAAYVNDTDVRVSVRRNPGGGDMVGIKFIFYNGRNSTSVDRYVVLEELEEEIFIFDSSEVPGVVNNTEISIAPIYTSESGKERLGNIMDTEEISGGVPPESIGGSVLLSSSSGDNFTTDDLTATPQNIGGYTTLIHDWKMDGSSIAVLNMPFDTEVSVSDTGAVRDYTSSPGNGTLGGGNSSKAPVWTSNGISGGAYDFDGIDDFIFRSGDSSDLTTQFSASAWIYPKQQRTQQILVCNYPAQFGFRVNSGNALHMIAYGTYLSNWTLYDLVGTNGEIPLNGWSHVAFTVSGTNLKLYKNGALVKSGSVPGTYLGGGNGGCNIGYFASWAPTRFNGTIDEVLVYDRVLSPEQIAAMYNAGVPRHNMIVSQETSVGDTWSVDVTPNNPTGDGTTISSNSLTIV
jgi:hypothetical protein